MKKMMLEDLKHEYMKSIQDRDNKIGQLRNQYKEHRERVTAETIVAVSDNFKKLEDEVDKKRRDIDNINNGMGGSAVANLKRANDETNKHNQFDTAPRQNELALLSYIRKYKTLSMMKQVLS